MIDDRWVRYHHHVSEEEHMIRLLRRARGFVLLSSYENWSLSAHEAAACGLPLLLPDRKWSRECFGNAARYFSHLGDSANIQILQQFYQDAPRLAFPAVRLYSWLEVAQQLKQVYERVVSTSL
jgi:glycosyltransferase involved in cell wall biosynthesis